MYTFQKNHLLTVHITKYNNGKNALHLIDAEEGTTFLTPSVNVPGMELPDNQIVLNDYDGTLKFLLKNNVIKENPKALMVGANQLFLCEINPRESWAPSELTNFTHEAGN